MRIVFIGSVKFSEKALQKLILLNANIVGVCTLKESKFNSDHCDLTNLCKKNHILVKYAPNVNSSSNLEWIKSLNPDIIFCLGWSRLLKSELISIPKRGVIGYHPTLLPKNRGRHPLIWSLCLGEKETGSSFFFMDEGADSGDILSQRKIKIDTSDDANTLYNKMIDTALIQIEDFFPKLLSKTEIKIKQDHKKANYWRKRNQKDGKIDWRMTADSIYNLTRSLTRPYVGAHFEYENKLYTVWKSQVVFHEKQNIEPGKVIKSNDKQITVKAGENAICLEEIEPFINIEEGSYL